MSGFPSFFNFNQNGSTEPLLWATFANLVNANLSEANLSRADLTLTNLSGADLNGANLSGAKLSYTDLSVVKLCNTLMPWGIDDSGCSASN